MAETSTPMIETTAAMVVTPAAAVVTTSATSDVAAETPPSPTATVQKPKYNKINIALFDLTLHLYTIATRTIDRLVEDANKAVLLAKTKLEMAERILPAEHPQRKKHVDRVADIEGLVTQAEGLVANIAVMREEYSANMPEYDTGLFADYNEKCVESFLGMVEGKSKEMKEACEEMAGNENFKALEGLREHFRRCKM